MRVKLILILLAVVVIGGAIAYFSNSNKTLSSVVTTATTTPAATSAVSGSTNSYDSYYQLAGYTSTNPYLSPDGKYVAVSESDEQGDVIILITDPKGKILTKEYCGFFDSWSPDSTKVRVLLPPECGYGGYDNRYYYLDINGNREAVEGSTFVPNAQ